MRERIAFLGGSLDIGRAPRGGTRLKLTVPLRGLVTESAA
jgi:signal transduction histidine kinase